MMHVFIREDFANLLAQAQHIDIDRNFERLALVRFIPNDQRNAAWRFAVHQNLIRADNDRFRDRRDRRSKRA